ncbi:MAG: hypothetical protein KME05_11030 [Gloeocapsa sp. UFS-A4-WI-NPMV-4B04]|jgi:hypothetical protein|nr:hypothetical protein [Gloeocapsa sp. UFS-A4-WI-NPMV-4B04]
MKLQTRTLRAFLVVAIEALSLVMLATAARTETIQSEGLPTDQISQTLVDSGNTSPESVPPEVLDTSIDANATADPPNPPLQEGQEASTNESPEISQISQTQTDPPISPPSEGGLGGITSAASTEVRILTPTPNAVVDVPATAVTLQFPVGAEVELKVNGVTVDSSLIGRTETDASTNLTTQTWYGVGLQPGENNITAQASAGQVTSVKVQVRGDTKQIKIQTLETRIPADGRSTATVQGELLDAKGNRSNQNAVITLVTSAGEFVGKDAKPDQAGFQVEARKGQFTASLRSSLDAQTVRILAKTNNLEAITQIQFETNLRPSIATGVINLRLGSRGTDYYDIFRNFLPADRDNGTVLDIDSAVFATGKIGDWLFTGAYNSDRPLNEDCNGNDRLFRDVQFCEQNYPVYGDGSKVEALTPSQDSLYLRFERSASIPNADPDFAMWGDYNTQEFARSSQEFTATNRQLHGFKANYTKSV